MFLKNYLKKNIFANLIRNSIHSFPSAYISPKLKKTSISDFFFYKCNEDFSSKIMLFNLSSHVLPEIVQSEIVKLFFFDQHGMLLKSVDYKLEYQEIREIMISDLVDDGYGSFFAFHLFKNFGELLENNSYIAERGYAAYKSKDSIWSFVHGNHNAAYLDNKYNIKSILGKSLKKNNFYTPQVSFLDQNEFEIIINNPSKSNISVEINLKDKFNSIIEKKIFDINSFGTKVFSCKKKIDILELNSMNILNRPIIIKYYESNFDIFHG